MTYTLALLELSPAAYDEIQRKLFNAGYTRAIDENPFEHAILDMNGIGVTRAAEATIDVGDEYTTNPGMWEP